jgi:hypothetical protein
MTEAKQCTKCGKKLRSDNTKGICGQAGPCAKRASAGGVDDAVLSSLGFGGESDKFAGKARDEAPPATKRPREKLKREPKPAPPSWQERFSALAAALGLKPDAMIEDFCRGWVEHTQQKALAPAPTGLKQLPAGEGEAAA